jgi:choline-sulfatase
VAENFLILMADQLAPAYLGAYGHPFVHTPNLDDLSLGSTVFDAAYTAYPLCAPSRAALLTGRYASDVGVYDNAAELAAGTPTVVHALRAAGYETALAGKMHFVGPDQLHGFEERLTTDIYPADVDWTPDWSRSLDDPLPWYHTMESIETPGAYAASMQTDFDDEVAFRAVRKLHELGRRAGDDPFLLCVSFTNPHDPWELPSRHWDLYPDQQIDEPVVAPIPLDRADPHSRRLRTMCGVDAAGLSAEQVRRARHGYYAAVSYLDERIGEVLGALRESGLEDSTTVIFTADHGEMLGERGLWFKMSFFENSARVPLLIRRPGVPPGRRRESEPVSLIDLAPTLLELAGVARDELPGDGVSLSGGVPPHPVVSEYHAEGVQAPAAMIRSGSHKLIVCGDDPDQLFDLSQDPLELDNLAGDRAELVASLRAQLHQRLDLEAIDARVRASQRERHLVARALRRGRHTPWDFQPGPDAAKQYIRNHGDMYELQRRARLDEPDAVDG